MIKMRFIIYKYVFLALTITQVFCECGKTKLQGHNLIAHGRPVERGTFPWHVAIYRVNWANGEIDHICGGSLIAPDLVISAAHCFYKEADQRMGYAFEYAVAAGKILRSYYEPEDYAQTSPVKSIHVPDGYTSSWRRSTNDIAVLRLQTPFTMTDYVSPVCIDWNSKYTEAHLRHGNIGKVMGWGLNAVWIPSEVLQQIDLPHIPREICRHGAPEDFLPYLQSDKICAGYLNGSSVCKGDSGGGHSFHSDGRWYLRGIASASAFPGNGTCNNNYYTAFTNVEHHLDWIRQFHIDAGSGVRNPTPNYHLEGFCLLPENPEGGRYEQQSCGAQCDHASGARVPIHTVLTYKCNEGYTLLGKTFSICENERWTPAPTCIECGKTKLQGHNLIAHGRPVELGTFPWHVAIYYVDWAFRYIDHICGGSLIAPDLVISAAHCFYKEADQRMGYAFEYAVAAGKIWRSYYEPEDYAQTSPVKSIHVPDGYTSSERRSNTDIAIVRLQTPFAMTDYVSPVCIDWNNKYTKVDLRHGNIGKVMGWGMNASRVPSEVLQQIDLPHISLNICIHGAPKDFLPDLQSDKICAGYLNGSSVCEGDSGGGHSFQSDGRWYLRGVVSTSAYPGNGTCNNNYYTAFTNVEHHLDWIRQFHIDAGEPDATRDSSTTGSCSLPEQPEGGRFNQNFCGRFDHAVGSRVPIYSVLIYRCNEGHTLRGNEYSICEDEGWTPPPTCVKPCPALRLANGDVLCRYNGGIVPCESAMAPGTRATLECHNYYNITPALEEIACLDKGVWTSSEFQCVPECGKAKSMETPLIVNGSEVMHGSFPWHVTVYDRPDDNRFLHTGTLIKPDLILSRAQRLYDKNTRKPYDANGFVVTAGKYYQSYYKSEPYAQTSLVKKIHIHNDYSGDKGNHSNNIALLRLKTPFTMSELVRPVCLDRRSVFAEGFSEVVKFPGYDTHGAYYESQGRLVNHASCSPSLDRSQRILLTPDRLCWKPKTATWRGWDIRGTGGIYAKQNDTWYLAGFPSIEGFSFFYATNVDTILSFILQVERD